MASYNQFTSPGYAPGQTSLNIPGMVPGMPLAPSPTALPPSLLSGTAANLQSGLAGELPEDVRTMLAQREAELGVASGMPGSQFNQYRGLRDLGLTSLQRKDQATSQLLPFFISPLQQEQMAQQSQRDAYNYDINRPRSGTPTGQPQYGMQENRPPMMAQPSSPLMPSVRNAPAASNSYQSVIGDIMGKYIGGNNRSMAPMSTTGRNDDAWMSGLAELGLLPDYEMGPYTGGTGSSGGYSAPGFYAGPSDPSTQALADMGIIDPLFSQPQESDGWENWMTADNWASSSNPYE